MRQFRQAIPPWVAFVIVQALWLALVISWVWWFLTSHQKLRHLLEQLSPERAPRSHDWLVFAEGLILLVAILAGIIVLFIFWQRQSVLYRQQKNFIAQVSHELKSPLASIQLYLETIRLRHPEPERLETFLTIMLADAERLNGLINNLLVAARLEQREPRPPVPPLDLHNVTSEFVERMRLRLPSGALLEYAGEPGVLAAIEQDEYATVLRNLLENATLYSPGAPEILVSLKRQGRWAELGVRDHGKGIARADLKRIFRRYYRVREPGETIRGTGLGLAIVNSIVREAGGQVTATSAGPGTGTLFTVRLPLCVIEARHD